MFDESLTFNREFQGLPKMMDNELIEVMEQGYVTLMNDDHVDPMVKV